MNPPHPDPRPYCWVRLSPDRPARFFRSLFGDGWLPVRSVVASPVMAGRHGAVDCYLVEAGRLPARVRSRAASLWSEARGCPVAEAVAYFDGGFPLPTDFCSASRQSLGPALGPPLAALPAGR